MISPSMTRADVAAQVRQRERRVEHLGPPGLGDDRAGVADLAARLGVERRAVEEDLDLIGRLIGMVDRDDRQHARLGGVEPCSRRTR